MRKYTVIGTQVQHSLSPRIHTLFAKQTQQRLDYELHYGYTLVAGGQTFAQAVAEFFANPNAHGMNITMPFKPEVLQVAGLVNERARRANSANTLMRVEDSDELIAANTLMRAEGSDELIAANPLMRAEGSDELIAANPLMRAEGSGKLIADNTDGVGLVADLLRLRAPLAGSRVLLLGAGGAASGVIESLLEAGIASLHIANRTEEKAESLAQTWNQTVPVSGSGLDRLPTDAEIVINATAAGHQGQFPPVDQNALRGAFCYDLSYAEAARAFTNYAEEAKAAQVHNGLGMLVEQAAESFYIWHGVRPQTEPVLQQLRTETNL